MRVAYPTTSAQYFHILRRQARDVNKRPLVLMQPKSMLRLAAATSRLDDLANGGFARGSRRVAANREDVTKGFCTQITVICGPRSVFAPGDVPSRSVPCPQRD